MKLGEYRKKTIEKLTCAGIERPAYVVDTLLSKILGADRAHIAAHGETEISDEKLCETEACVEKRLQRVPLSYILGEAEFYGYKFKVGQGCLIPRPETELLTEEMLKIAPQNGIFADWCTGSGCIAIAMLLERPDLKCVAVDASSEALAWAEKNRELHGLNDRLQLILNSCPAELSYENSFDFITANPPYIPEDEIQGLMKDVAAYEPEMALNGGKDGVEVYHLFFDTLPVFLKKNGYFGVETAGNRQAELLKQKAPSCLELAKEISDYNGILRHLIWQKR